MIGLRELVQRFDPEERGAGLRFQSSLVKPSRTPPATVSLREVLADPTLPARIRRAPFKAIAQNTALMPPITANVPPWWVVILPPVLLPFVEVHTEKAYKGRGREHAIAKLIAELRAAAADVVGLTECWLRSDRERIIRELADVYPHALAGPGGAGSLSLLATAAASAATAAGIAEELPLGSGLLLLSRHPIIATDSTQYVHATGLDALSSKSALHARLLVASPTGAYEYDVFLTHLQAKDAASSLIGAGKDTSSEDKRIWQLRHLATFIRSCSGPERPVLLMGDLNVKEDQLELLRKLLGGDDLWTLWGVPHPEVTPPKVVNGETIDGISGVTLDDGNNFETKPPKFSERFRDPTPDGNSRVDYLLSWPGNTRKPIHRRIDLLTFKTRTYDEHDGEDNDISDHYGLASEQTHLREPAVDLSRGISRVVLQLHTFHCLRVSNWPSFTGRLDDDEVLFKLRFRSERGETGEAANGAVYPQVESGDQRELAVSGIPPLTLELGDPGAWLDVLGTGEEADTRPGFATTYSSLGEGLRRISREALLRQGFWSYDYVLPRLIGDGGEYALTVRVTVELK